MYIHIKTADIFKELMDYTEAQFLINFSLKKEGDDRNDNEDYYENMDDVLLGGIYTYK